MFATMAVVFLLDVDNTLIDNDRARERLTADVDDLLGPQRAKNLWTIYEEVRADLGYVDSLETLARFRAQAPDAPVGALDRLVLDFPYAEVRYEATLGVLATLRSVGTPVVLSDGDPVFQPLKIARAGIDAAVAGNVLVFTHKEDRLDDVARLFPATRYVAVDDKAGLLARIKRHWGAKVGTVHVLQGKYADDPYDGPAPDAAIASIGDLGALVGTADRLRVLLEKAEDAGRIA